MVEDFRAKWAAVSSENSSPSSPSKPRSQTPVLLVDFQAFSFWILESFEAGRWEIVRRDVFFHLLLCFWRFFFFLVENFGEFFFASGGRNEEILMFFFQPLFHRSLFLGSLKPTVFFWL